MTLAGKRRRIRGELLTATIWDGIRCGPPDGQRIAFISDRDVTELFVMDATAPTRPLTTTTTQTAIPNGLPTTPRRL